MAKRMGSTDISLCEKLEACSEWAQLLFDRMIFHQDEWGRMVGNPAKVKAKLKPLSKRSPAQFEKAIQELHNAGLICWYGEDEKFIALHPHSCEEYQAGIHTKAVASTRHSKFPAPDDIAFRWPEDGTIQENPGQSSIKRYKPNLTEPNLTEPNLTEPNLTSCGKNKSAAEGCGWCLRPKENQGEDYDLVIFHHREYKKRFSDCPNTGRAVGRNRKELKELLKLHPPDEIRGIITYALDCPADWVKTLSGILAKFDELALAKKKGTTYGATRTNLKTDARRHNPSDPSTFQATGAASWD